MIGGINLILSQSISNNNFLKALREIGESYNLPDADVTQVIFNGHSTVWIKLVTLEDCFYDEAELTQFEELLSDSAKSVISIEYDSTLNSDLVALDVAKKFAKKWLAVLDDCYETIYDPDEIEGITMRDLE